MIREFTLDADSPVIHVRVKIWLEINGERFIGEGRAQLLRLIQETGSINAAARKKGMSFRRAWAVIKEMEENVNMALVVRKRGGAGGGMATLTPTAIDLLERFEALSKEFKEAHVTP